MSKKVEFELEDGHVGKVQCSLEVDASSILLGVKGYGDCCTVDGYGHPIRIELYEGELRLEVFADINQEDSTHRISLEGAREDKRIEDI